LNADGGKKETEVHSLNVGGRTAHHRFTQEADGKLKRANTRILTNWKIKKTVVGAPD